MLFTGIEADPIWIDMEAPTASPVDCVATQEPPSSRAVQANIETGRTIDLARRLAELEANLADIPPLPWTLGHTPPNGWIERRDRRDQLAHAISEIREELRIVKAAGSVANSGNAPLHPLQAHIIGVGRALAERLARSPESIHDLTPGQFQEFVCDRLYAMGMEPKQVGEVYAKDGGIDILFWPRMGGAFPFLGAAQVKHHRNPNRKVGPATVRDFAGAIACHPFGAAMLVTNTSFTPDAEWFTRKRARLIRLRDFEDLVRWLQNDFSNAREWREIPKSIELCPGLIVSTHS